MEESNIIFTSQNIVQDENQERDDETKILLPKLKYPITISLEQCKNKFFNNEYVQFGEELKKNNFKIYIGKYKYSSDYDGKPIFIIKNLLNGFCQQLDDKRKYLFVLFK